MSDHTILATSAEGVSLAEFNLYYQIAHKNHLLKTIWSYSIKESKSYQEQKAVAYKEYAQIADLFQRLYEGQVPSMAQIETLRCIVKREKGLANMNTITALMRRNLIERSAEKNIGLSRFTLWQPIYKEEK